MSYRATTGYLVLVRVKPSEDSNHPQTATHGSLDFLHLPSTPLHNSGQHFSHQAPLNMDCPGDRDILCGDVNSFFDHLGNRRFRKLVDLHIEEYLADSTACERLVANIELALMRSGYRFLKFNMFGLFERLPGAEVTRTVSYLSRIPWRRDGTLGCLFPVPIIRTLNLSLRSYHFRSAHP